MSAKLKGPSWADQTAEEEELEEQRLIEELKRKSAASKSASPPTPSTVTPSTSTSSTNQRQLSSSAYPPLGGSTPSRSADRQSEYSRGTPSSNSNSRGNDRDQRSGGGGGYDSRDSRGPSSSSNYGGNQRSGGGRDSNPPPQRMSLDAREAREREQQGYGSGGGGYGGRDNRSGGYGGGSSTSSRGNDEWSRGPSGGGYGRDSQSSRGGPNDRDRDRDRDSGPRNRGNSFQREKEPALPKETGIVSVVKEGFGFLRCADREGEVFFHFSDFPNSATQPPRKGDEVSFGVKIDPRDQRARASQIEVLPKGSVVFEATLAEGVRGIVIREMRGQFTPAAARKMGGKRMTLAESLSQGRQEAYGGKIKRLSEDEDATAAALAVTSSTTPASPAPASSPNASTDEVYEFSERDLSDPNVLLFAGDLIRFNIFVEKKSSRKGATKVTLLEPNPIGRERGKVVSVRDGYGFIEIEKELQDEEDEQSQSSQSRFDRRDQNSGRQTDQLFFHFSEFIDANHTPNMGDELSFIIGQSPGQGTHKVSAQRIQVLPKGSLNSREVGRETLTGTVTKEITYESTATPKPISTTTTETVSSPASSPVSSPNPNPSPSPSPVSSEESIPTPADTPNPLAREPTASPTAASSSSSSKQRKMIPGTISYTDSTGVTIELPFRPSDLPSDRRAPTLLLKGDTVQFHLLTLTQRSVVTKRATQISLQPSGWSKLNREQGVVTAVKDGGFSFVDSVTRAEKVFLHHSQIRGGPGLAARADATGGRNEREPSFVGLEVEFNVIQEQPGKYSAIRVVTLPPGTVQFEEILPMTFTGRIKHGLKRHVNRNQPKPGTDSSSFSKNDLRRDQAASSQVQARGAERGEKGELTAIALANGSEPLPADFQLPATVGFYEVDVVDPAEANLDATSLVADDSVTFQLRRHKRTGKLSALKVQLTAISSVGRERGQVCRLKPEQGLGFLLIPTQVKPIGFYLRDAPKGVAVGDAFEFNIAEPNVVHKKQHGDRPASTSGGDDKPHAVRLTPLPAGSVEIYKVDRTTRLRGYISTVPERSSAGRPSSKKAGQLIRLVSGPVVHISSTLASILTHPASWPNVEVAPLGEYNAAQVHPAAFAIDSTRASSSPEEEKFSFTYHDVAGTSFLSKGDLLDFYVSERTQPVVERKAVEISVVPFQGIVEKIDVAAGQESNAIGARAYSGVISVFNPQANHTEESFVFNSKDVIVPPAPTPSPSADGSSTSSPSPPPPFELCVGDTVEFSDCILAGKKRQARMITRVKEGGGTSAKSAIKREAGARRAPGTAIVYASRFARGPDAQGIGFAPRKSAVAAAASSSSTTAQ